MPDSTGQALFLVSKVFASGLGQETTCPDGTLLHRPDGPDGRVSLSAHHQCYMPTTEYQYVSSPPV